MAFTNNVRSWQ